MKIFVICSVRGATEEYKKFLEEYAERLIELGHEVYLPHKDTKQNQIGIQICRDNREGIRNTDEVHVSYRETSTGTHFDMGMAFALGKKVRIIDSDPFNEKKSFARFLWEWESGK